MAKLESFLCIVIVVMSLLIGLSSGDDPPPLVTDVPTIYSHVCDPSRFKRQGMEIADIGYCDTSLSYEDRAKDLVKRMTLEEKVQQLGNRANGASRIGLPAYEWWSEALHGVSKTGPGTFFDDEVPGATSFPTVILTTASFNQSLWKRIGQVVSSEARAMYNLGRAGLTFWSPNINVIRDPRWGRIMETPGEDPFVVGTYASTYVRALQDVEGTENTTDLNSRPLKISACCKHYTAYDLEDWLGMDRFHFDSRVTEQDMLETYQRPFEMCVRDGDASSIMCSFNNVNGIPPCADTNLLKNTIRGDWGLHGYIVSDCDSIEVIVDDQKWLKDSNEDAVSQVMKAGLDLDCGDFYPKYLQSAVMKGEVREADIDKSLNYLYVVLMRLGYFDGSPAFKSLGKKNICAKENLELAAQAAKEGIVLLKNDNATLPLDSSKFKKLALIGPHANATQVMIGNYAGIPCRYVSPLSGFSAYGEVTYEMGCGDVACKNDTFMFSALQAAKEADATILLMGLDLSVEREGLDRVDLLLPGYQTLLINQVAKASKGPVILVLMCAGVVDISFAKDNQNIKAILWAGYPGQEGGAAIADIVYGKQNPGGRLPLTWYKAEYADMIPMTSMQLRPVDSFGYPGRTYKFFNGSTVYPFGYGLSYTTFSYKLKSSKKLLNVNLNKHQHCHYLNYTDNANTTQCPAVVVDDLSCEHEFVIEAVVQNVGEMDGSEVVMVYSKPPEGIIGTHLKQLIGFKRVFVSAGGETKVSFTFNACQSLSIVDKSAYKVLPSGLHTIIIGDGVVSSSIEVQFN